MGIHTRIKSVLTLPETWNRPEQGENEIVKTKASS